MDLTKCLAAFTPAQPYTCPDVFAALPTLCSAPKHSLMENLANFPMTMRSIVYRSSKCLKHAQNRQNIENYVGLLAASLVQPPEQRNLKTYRFDSGPDRLGEISASEISMGLEKFVPAVPIEYRKRASPKSFMDTLRQIADLHYPPVNQGFRLLDGNSLPCQEMMCVISADDQRMLIKLANDALSTMSDTPSSESKIQFADVDEPMCNYPSQWQVSTIGNFYRSLPHDLETLWDGISRIIYRVVSSVWEDLEVVSSDHEMHRVHTAIGSNMKMRVSDLKNVLQRSIVFNPPRILEFLRDLYWQQNSYDLEHIQDQAMNFVSVWFAYVQTSLLVTDAELMSSNRKIVRLGNIHKVTTQGTQMYSAVALAQLTATRNSGTASPLFARACDSLFAACPGSQPGCMLVFSDIYIKCMMTSGLMQARPPASPSSDEIATMAHPIVQWQKPFQIKSCTPMMTSSDGVTNFDAVVLGMMSDHECRRIRALAPFLSYELAVTRLYAWRSRHVSRASRRFQYALKPRNSKFYYSPLLYLIKHDKYRGPVHVSSSWTVRSRIMHIKPEGVLTATVSARSNAVTPEPLILPNNSYHDIDKKLVRLIVRRGLGGMHIELCGFGSCKSWAVANEAQRF